MMCFNQESEQFFFKCQVDIFFDQRKDNETSQRLLCTHKATFAKFSSRPVYEYVIFFSLAGYPSR